nr:K511 [uncultured bacterium]
MSGARFFLVAGALSAAVAVMLGAFGAHALRSRLPTDLLAIYQTASQYHVYHALGLLAVGLLAVHLPASNALRWSGWLMLLGTVLFSGSLYVLAITGQRWLGAITPLGGTAWIAAWLLLAWAARGLAL